MTLSVDNPTRTRRTTYVVLAVIFLLLTVTALLVFRAAKSSAAANDKADQLISALGAAGLPAPSKEQVVRVLGDDGGAVCANPGSALTRASLYSQLTNGTGGPGQRPVIAADNVVRGELEIIRIYCPEELSSFQKFVDDLKTADVTRE
jgi:hypothetical protein